MTKRGYIISDFPLYVGSLQLGSTVSLTDLDLDLDLIVQGEHGSMRGQLYREEKKNKQEWKIKIVHKIRLILCKICIIRVFEAVYCATFTQFRR